MNSDIRYLQLLEGDLGEAARFERELDEEQGAVDAQGRPRTAPRRLPRRGRWTSVAAVLVAFLVVAGGIGFLAQKGSLTSNEAGTAGTAAPQVLGPAPVAPRLPNRHQGVTSSGNSGTTRSSLDSLSAEIEGKFTSPNINQSKGTGGALVASGPQGDLSKIVRNGQIGIQVNNGAFSDGVDQVTKIADDNHGMVLSSTSENERSGTFTLRIPVARFDRVIKALRAIAPPGGILYQDATGQDVTANFIDFTARLDILKKQRDLLIGLQSHVTDAGQILFYADKINTVQLNIESIQGQLNFLNNSVAESTIKVELREKDAPQGTASNDITKPSLRSAWNFSIQGFLRVLGAMLIGLGYLIPLSVIGLLVWGAVMLARRRRRATS